MSYYQATQAPLAIELFMEASGAPIATLYCSYENYSDIAQNVSAVDMFWDYGRVHPSEDAMTTLAWIERDPNGVYVREV